MTQVGGLGQEVSQESVRLNCSHGKCDQYEDSHCARDALIKKGVCCCS